jgi:hypothetical protein
LNQRMPESKSGGLPLADTPTIEDKFRLYFFYVKC